KLFRRLHAGANPDVEVTRALAETGYPNVAAPLATWERDGAHVAVVQPFLAGATEGWSLALTSLRDFYNSDCENPRECGGDLGAESRRLGEVTASMHLALARAFGDAEGDARAWSAAMLRQLDRVGKGRAWEGGARAVFERMADGDAGRSIRVHGDLHLGQVVRADAGWYVLDFEGEPARPLDERTLATSPLKDVAGMLRSFDYAVAVAAREWPDDQRDDRHDQGLRWLERNRFAFLEGYFGTEGIAALLPSPHAQLTAALEAWELDKAVYEVGYEEAHRPEWSVIPEAAIARLLGG
ncbi:MAG TPA: hypothetical protein VHN98_11395, partial [Acidimicrobiales bacterium]|nr:hypothetical protein [Acidimicrobiales bacterium]